MMMHATNVSVPIAILVILTKIILTSLEGDARYAFLFKLDITDYKDGARGLKKLDTPQIRPMLTV